MVYITGDCHGNFQRFTKRHRAAFGFTEEDHIIICGDFGLLWAKNRELEYNLSWLSALPFTILWVQGNHENYDMIAEYPIEVWNGGKARHIMRDKIILLERGQVFRIEGRSFFTFGGASSHDIQGGILDRDSPDYDLERSRAIKQGLPYRVRHISWWEQELPDEQEMQEGRNNLEKAGYNVEYVVSHCLSGGMQERLSRYIGSAGYGDIVYERDVLTDYFDELESKMQFRHWFCGHYHVNLKLDEKHTVLYGDIVPLTGVL